MDTFIQQVLNGLVLGSLYALVALGYTMVYGILNLINFAHGDVLMVGAMRALTVSCCSARFPVCPAGPAASPAWRWLFRSAWWLSLFIERSPTGRCAAPRAWRR